MYDKAIYCATRLLLLVKEDSMLISTLHTFLLLIQCLNLFDKLTTDLLGFINFRATPKDMCLLGKIFPPEHA